MRFRCSGNGCPIRGPLYICSGRLWGSRRSPVLHIAVWIRTKCTHKVTRLHIQVDFVPSHHTEHPRYKEPAHSVPHHTRTQHLLWKLNGTRQLPLLVITVHAAQSYLLLIPVCILYSPSPSSPY